MNVRINKGETIVKLTVVERRQMLNVLSTLDGLARVGFEKAEVAAGSIQELLDQLKREAEIEDRPLLK